LRKASIMFFCDIAWRRGGGPRPRASRDGARTIFEVGIGKNRTERFPNNVRTRA